MWRSAVLFLIAAMGCAAEDVPDDGYPYPAMAVTSPSPAWAAPAGRGIAEVEVDGDGTVYAMDEDALFAWSAEGTPRFEQRGVHHGIAATARGVLAARDGEVVALDPDGTVRWRVRVTLNPTAFEGTPIPPGGFVWVGPTL